MNDFLSAVERLVSDGRRTAGLLALEKRRRGVIDDRLLFVGVSNIASVRWCPMKAVLKSRAEELMFFSAYLADRLVYARLLGLIDCLPHSDRDLLSAGDEIGMTDVERLLRRLPARTEPEPRAYYEAVGPGGETAWVLSPDLSAVDRTHFRELASRAGVRVLDLEDDPKVRGLVLEEMRAERYPTIRWNFAWERYVVVGVPDGITDDLIYEYKTTRSRYLGGHLLPTALVQADLYGLFFNRTGKRVQLYVVEEDATQTWDRPVDRNAAESALKEFRSVDEERRPRPPRERWKCRRCDVRTVCPICPLSSPLPQV
jgi:CRISPR/Cas system-associated exonuclease Cas4 (RecB family)